MDVNEKASEEEISLVSLFKYCPDNRHNSAPYVAMFAISQCLIHLSRGWRVAQTGKPAHSPTTCDNSDLQWIQANLPVRDGVYTGEAFVFARSHCPAFSLLLQGRHPDWLHLIRERILQSNLTVWSAKFDDVPDTLPTKQPFWNRHGVFDSKAQVSAYHRASFSTVSCQHSGDWLFALPIAIASWVNLNDEAVRVGVCFRLGLDDVCIPHHQLTLVGFTVLFAEEPRQVDKAAYRPSLGLCCSHALRVITNYAHNDHMSPYLYRKWSKILWRRACAPKKVGGGGSPLARRHDGIFPAAAAEFGGSGFHVHSHLQKWGTCPSCPGVDATGCSIQH